MDSHDKSAQESSTASESPTDVTPAVPGIAPQEPAKPTGGFPRTDQPGSSLDAETSKEVDEMLSALESEGVDSLMTADQAPRPSTGKDGVQKCQVVAVSGDDVFVDAGGRSQGVVPLQQFGNTPPEVGQAVDLVVDYFDSESQLLVMSREGAIQAANWETLQKGVVVEGRITGMNKGGLEVDLKGIRAFMPASQVDVARIQDISIFIGQKVRCVVTEVKRKSKDVLVSRRKYMEKEREEARDELMGTLTEGATVSGKVARITEFGAFVDLGGVDGLLHIKDLSYGRVAKVEDVLKVGETVDVKVLKIDSKKDRISLGLKQARPDPWSTLEQKYEPGMRLAVRVISLADFGAFAELEEGIEGLIPISEMSRTKRVRSCSEVVSVGDVVEVEILRADPVNRKISMSMKQLEADPWRGAISDYPEEGTVKGTVTRLADFGAFVELRPGVEGLIHISQLSDKHIKSAAEVVSPGQEVEVRILGVDSDKRRISLSMRTPEEMQASSADYSIRGNKPRKRKKPLRGGLNWGGMGDDIGGLTGLGG